MRASSQLPKAKILNVVVAGSLATVEFELSREDYLHYPIAPAALYDDGGNLVFGLDQLVGREGCRLRFESYQPHQWFPGVGQVYEFSSLWNHWAMDAVRDLSVVWKRQKYPYPGEHHHCLLTWQTIAYYSDHNEGSEHGWITTEAYQQKYIQEDRCRIRSDWRSIENRPTS